MTDSMRDSLTDLQADLNSLQMQAQALVDAYEGKHA